MTLAGASSSAAADAVAASAAGGLGGPPPPHPNPEKIGMTNGAPGGPLKIGNVAEQCERIKEEFNFIQNQYHSLKLECEKLAQDKTEMQRHYVMYYEMSYGLNVEMHKQTEIGKRLDAIIRQVLPFLSGEHQQQVEMAKQITMAELNAVMQQQAAAGSVPGMPPGMPPPVSMASGLLSLAGHPAATSIASSMAAAAGGHPAAHAAAAAAAAAAAGGLHPLMGRPPSAVPPSGPGGPGGPGAEPR